ncbi:MAG: class I tRNA ligase family protein, partial [Phycisphaerales bacterium]|nr:class I tRNA ligase family protein [Phycisphaerales bacterium]
SSAGEAGVSSLPPGAPVRRETNTMPGWAGSCWYYLRYCDPKNGERFVGREAERAWMLTPKNGVARDEIEAYGTFPEDLAHVGGVDLYVGGAEHAVLHLLYARFWHKVLFDLGELSTPEPFGKLFHQGLILSHAYQRGDKSLVPTDEVENKGSEDHPEYIETATGEVVTQIVAKMSKSLKNVVNPDDVIEEFGADTFRLYEMYMGPLEASKPWDTRAIGGMFRFLRDVWRLCIDENSGEPRVADGADDAIEKLLHRTIAKVGGDIERLAFNTGIAAMIEFKNAAIPRGGLDAGSPTLTTDQIDRFMRILAPFAPHLAEEVWSRLGPRDACLAESTWPGYDEAMLTDDEIEIPVQILGKVRGKVTVPADADQKAMEAAALGDERIKALLEGKTVRKVIVVPGRLVNIVAN